MNLLEMDAEEEETVMPSRSSQFTILAPDNSPMNNGGGGGKKELDLSITASPSGYLTRKAPLLHTPPIKEEERESEDSSDDWNW